MLSPPASHLGSPAPPTPTPHPRHLWRGVDAAAAGTLNGSRLLRGGDDASVIPAVAHSRANVSRTCTRTCTRPGRAEGCSVVSDFQLIHKHKGPLCGPMTTLIHSLSQFLSCQPSQIPPTSSEQLRSTADERIKCSFSEEKIPPPVRSRGLRRRQPATSLVAGGFCLCWKASQLTAPLKNGRQ